MICGIIWADEVAPRSAKAASGFKKLAIVTTKKTYKKNNRQKPRKAKPFERISSY